MVHSLSMGGVSMASWEDSLKAELDSWEEQLLFEPQLLEPAESVRLVKLADTSVSGVDGAAAWTTIILSCAAFANE